HQMVFTIPGRMTSFFVVLHSPNMRHRSPKGEGFSDPGGGTLKKEWNAWYGNVAELELLKRTPVTDKAPSPKPENDIQPSQSANETISEKGINL
ncbi:hypothetical protein WDW86_10920, partial [Bdellovibrionota bacterium FG-2]